MMKRLAGASKLRMDQAGPAKTTSVLGSLGVAFGEDATRLAREYSRPSIKRCSGHSEITGNLRSGFTAFDQADSASNLTVGDPARSAAKVLSGFSAFADGVGDAFAFDLVFHLRESGHDREHHRPHGCCGVDVATAEVQDAQARASAAEFVGEGEHVLGGSSEPVQRRDDEGVAIDQRVECPIELGREARAPDTP